VWTVRETISNLLNDKSKRNESKEYESKESIVKELRRKLNDVGVKEDLVGESILLREVQTGMKRWI
jgi:hypothetical protein